MTTPPGHRMPADEARESAVPAAPLGHLGRILVVTGTDTGVGKTVVTAALAAALARHGSVAIDKPVQTGVAPGQPGDADEAGRLSGVTRTGTGLRLTLPMAPAQAARREGTRLPGLGVHVARIRALAARFDTVLVEGAGGLLVHLDDAGHTIADLARALGAPPATDPGRAARPALSVVVVTRPGLGALNHTELTLDALRARGLTAAGTVLGSWPQQPGPVESDNREHLRSSTVPLLGAVPLGAPGLGPAGFRAAAPLWFLRTEGARR